MKASSGGMKSGMLKGMSNHSPKQMDGSGYKTSKSVNDGATRESTAATPKTLGPRDA